MIILTVQIPVQESFGLNFNLFDTNILNLAVVIGVVVSFGGNALQALLNNRKDIILSNLYEADKKAQQAQNRLNKMKTQLELAKKKAIEIREQGINAAKQEKEQQLLQTKQNAARFLELKQQEIESQKQKAIKTIAKHFVLVAFEKTRVILHDHLNGTSLSGSTLTNFNILLFKYYNE